MRSYYEPFLWIITKLSLNNDKMMFTTYLEKIMFFKQCWNYMRYFNILLVSPSSFLESYYIFSVTSLFKLIMKLYNDPSKIAKLTCPYYQKSISLKCE